MIDIALPWDDIFDAALMVGVTYVLGCCLGYVAHRAVLGLARRRHAQAMVKTTQPAVPRVSAAIRLASSVEPMPLAKGQNFIDKTLSAQPDMRPSGETMPRLRLVSSQPNIPAVLSTPNSGEDKNLQLIKGIGPKIESSLHGLGIYHVSQLSKFSPENVEWLETKLSLNGRAKREKWVEQARALTAGKLQA
jgi:predicted flap endonuclease-1-like 5' DNA nuclease